MHTTQGDNISAAHSLLVGGAMAEPRSALYEILARNDLGDLSGAGIAKRIHSWKRERVEQITHELFAAIPRSTDRATSPYDFVASSQLAGGPFPCIVPHCRAERLSELSRFAALYATSVVIPDPVSLNSENNPTADELAADVVLLEQIKPLVEAGIIRFSDTTGHV